MSNHCFEEKEIPNKITSLLIKILGLLDKFIKNNKLIYKLCIYPCIVISVISTIGNIFNITFISDIFRFIPLYSVGFGWVTIFILTFILSIIIDLLKNRKKQN